MSKPARPDLRFDTVDAMLADADRLRAGYERAGQWDLGMVLDHLTKSMLAPLAPGQRDVPWPVSAIGRVLVRGLVRRGRYPRVKFPVLPALRPTPGIDVDAARAAFGAAAERVRDLPGETVACPPIGTLATSDFRGLHLVHGAHHLSFLRPTTGV